MSDHSTTAGESAPGVSRLPAPEQLVFDLPVRRALGRRDLLVAASNSDAVAWLDRWPDWPDVGLVLCGPAASGKTHHVSVWDARAKAVWLAGSDLDRMAGGALAGSAADTAAVILDDVDRLLAGRPDREEAVFHLFNRLRAGGGALLMTAARSPARWGLTLRDLSSRLKTLPVAAIGPPDEPLLASLIVKHFGDRQVQISPEVVDFILRRADRSFAGVDRVVAAIDCLALAAGRPITVPLARQALERLAPADQWEAD